MSFIYVADGIDDVLAAHLNQYADAWSGVAGKGQPFNAVAVNDPINFAISGRNLDPTNSRTLQLLKADGTVLLQVDVSGVKISPDGTIASVPATLNATQTFTNKNSSYVAGQGNTLTVPACRVFNSAALSIPAAANTALTFNSERYKTDAGMHSTASLTERLVATVAGKHRITGHAAFAAGAAGTQRALSIQIAGAVVAWARFPFDGTNACLMTVTTDYHMAVGDYAQLMAYQDSGVALNVIAAGNYSPECSMSYIGA